jgi:hypothetical protein
MSDKMECPGCGAYSSSVLIPVRDGQPCPFCGLSAAAISEIQGVRRARADEALRKRLEAALIERDRARTEAEIATRMLEAARSALGCEYPYAPHDASAPLAQQ